MRDTCEARRALLRTEDPVMAEALRLARGVAPTAATVLITGESGTGKEVVARLIHAASPRRGGPFVAVHCAAVPESLAESELFGHERGSFTGASERRIGKMQAAAGGTLLLDDVSDMPAPLQAKLLRALQEGEVTRVGGNEPVKLDCRVVATSNRDLRSLVRQGLFRQDLYYRLNVFPIRLPPLRQRACDIPALADHLLEEACLESGRTIPALSGAARELLASLPFQGNVRELRNMMQRAAILAEGPVVEPRHLALDHEQASDPFGLAAGAPAEAHSLRDVETVVILRALTEAGGNRTEASRALGISVRTLRNRLRDYRRDGIAVPAGRASEAAA